MLTGIILASESLDLIFQAEGTVQPSNGEQGSIKTGNVHKVEAVTMLATTNMIQASISQTCCS